MKSVESIEEFLEDLEEETGAGTDDHRRKQVRTVLEILRDELREHGGPGLPEDRFQVLREELVERVHRSWDRNETRRDEAMRLEFASVEQTRRRVLRWYRSNDPDTVSRLREKLSP